MREVLGISHNTLERGVLYKYLVYIIDKRVELLNRN
jgi:hypothetical protein